ncbi:MAG: DsbA family protein [Deltaproteobacteria bacterium]|nr:DsbA family protein [Deltaproteobacteria bacterium]
MLAELWFDFSCPYAYLASTQVERLAARTGATIDPRPMLLGGVFRAHAIPANLSAAISVPKARANAADLARWARVFGVVLSFPSGHPFRTVDALRALLVIGLPSWGLIHRLYRAYWVEGIDLGDRVALARLLSEAGHDGARVMAEIDRESVKDDLRRRTEEAISRGVFGAPAFFVEDALFWGQDRLADVERALGGSPAPLGGSPAPLGGSPAPLGASSVPIAPGAEPVEFFFDYACPWAAIAAERVEALFGAALSWRPVRLDTILRRVNPPNGGLPHLSEAKRAYLESDLRRQAERFGVVIEAPSRQLSWSPRALAVSARAASQAPQQAPALIRALFRARWAEGRDIEATETLEACAQKAGIDAGTLFADAAASDDALERATEEALERGVFGVPAVTVGDRAVFFGQDRLELAARAVVGDDPGV